MASNSINTNLKFVTNGQDTNPPEEWMDISVNAAFDNDNIQANINFDSFRFVNVDNQKSSKILRDWISNGFPGIMEGVPFLINGYNNQNSLSVFDGFVDLSDDVALLEDGSTIAKIKKRDGLNSLDERLGALTWGYLEDIGAVSSGDYISVDYVVEKKFNFFEIVMSNIVLFLLIKELTESIKDLSKQVNDAFAHTTGGLSGPAAGAAWTVVAIIIQILYTTLIALAVFNLGKQLFELLLPKVRTHKAIQLRRALEIISNHLGYSFVGIATEFDNVYYLPSNTNQDEVSFVSGLITQLKGTSVGIPNVTDSGYSCSSFFNMCKDLIDGKPAIINGELHLRAENDPFWIKQASFQMPDVLIEEQKFNTDELFSRFEFTFAIDQRDEWTIDNYKGTAYVSTIDSIQTNITQAKFIKGINEVKMPVSLGNRKDQLNGIERLLKNIAQFMDNTINALGGSSNFANGISNKVGMLKVTHNNHSIAKLLYLRGGKLPANHRQLFSAKVVYTKYYNHQSFVQNNFGRQRLVYDQVQIPFGLGEFLQLIDNSYFYDNQNRIGKIKNIDWSIMKDTAIVDYWIKEIYAPNLKETFLEPE
jgi:hypothetical protein